MKLNSILAVALGLLLLSAITSAAYAAEAAGDTATPAQASTSRSILLYNYTTGKKDSVNLAALSAEKAKAYLPPINGAVELFDAHINAGHSVPESIAMTYAGIAKALAPDTPKKE